MEHTLEYMKRMALVTKIAKIAAGVLLLLLAVWGVVQIAAWAKLRRENRQWTAVHNLTPERLIARCGQPLEDKTQIVFPIVQRGMSYKASGGKTVVFAFSRTAEQESDWVFTSMKDAQNDMSYDTPESQILALSCLDSRK